MDLVGLMEGKRGVIEAALARYLPDDGHVLTQAMRYSLFAPGKRLRPIFAILAYEAAGGKEADEILPAACALEYVHTFTLIHDDLPSMDDDDFRRGKPSNHKVFGEGLAILAGDALMIDGLGLVAQSAAPAELVRRAVAEFSRILGAGGVTWGQADDLYGVEVG
ncbi:polyprenyl synthetase family protein, partial [candidate division WOR-3 bacterium]|nr:polyprenyl synthetase family protein [candidate division WOR-3 bacterium]